jgi:hypothetical protein
MGKKPVMALAGLCLASTALVGCCGGNQSCRPQQPGYHTTPTWSNNPQNPQPGSQPGALPGAGQSAMPGTPVGGMQSPPGGMQPMSGSPTLGGVQPMSGGATPGGMQPGMSGLGQPVGAFPSNNTGLQTPIPGNGNTPGLPGRGADGLGGAGAGAFGRTVEDAGMGGPMPPAPPPPGAGARTTSSFGGSPAGFSSGSMPPAPPSYPGTGGQTWDRQQEEPPPPVTMDRNGSQVIPGRPMGVPNAPINPAVMPPMPDNP